jgi:hypothetical protein
LPRYFLDRKAGNLYPKEDVAALLRSGRRPRTVAPEPEHPLVPDGATLGNFLEKRLQTVTPDPYVVAAILEFSPTWLSFLESRGLLAETEATAALPELQDVRRRVRSLLAPFPDPELQ